MNTISATDARKEWSSVIDSVVREKPQMITRTRDKMWMSSLDTIKDILSGYTFTAEKFIEPDFSVTISLNEIDLVEHAGTEEEARLRMAKAIIAYAEDFYKDYEYWSKAENRKSHIPYVFKALLIGDEVKLGEEIECRDGKN